MKIKAYICSKCGFNTQNIIKTVYLCFIFYRIVFVALLLPLSNHHALWNIDSPLVTFQLDQCLQQELVLPIISPGTTSSSPGPLLEPSTSYHLQLLLSSPANFSPLAQRLSPYHEIPNLQKEGGDIDSGGSDLRPSFLEQRKAKEA